MKPSGFTPDGRRWRVVRPPTVSEYFDAESVKAKRPIGGSGDPRVAGRFAPMTSRRNGRREDDNR